MVFDLMIKAFIVVIEPFLQEIFDSVFTVFGGWRSVTCRAEISCLLQPDMMPEGEGKQKKMSLKC